MSHIVESKTSIKNPNRELLTQACQIVTETHEGGEIKEEYLNYGMQPQSTSLQLAIFTNTLHRGLGIELDRETGNLTFVGDPWRVRETFEQVQQQVIQTYVSLAMMKALAEMGYETQAVASEQPQQVVLQGVNYA